MHLGEEDISESALQWIKANKALIIKKFADPDEFKPDASLISLFMAGSPGAGKTEVSTELIKRFDKKPVRIDADEIRAICPGYTGENAHLFQKAASKGVNILYDHVLSKNINVILDGTFAYGGAIQNIERSLEKGRKVELYFVYQDPITAWDLTKKREALEKRHVSREVFIDAFLVSRTNANQAKAKFGDRLEMSVLIKNFETGLESFELNVNEIDSHLPRTYTRNELENIIV